MYRELPQVRRHIIGKAWVIQDEALHLDASNKEDWQTNGGGDIVYQDFDGSIREFEISTLKANGKLPSAGILVSSTSFEDTEQCPYCWMTGLEVQVLDNGTDSTEGHPDALFTSTAQEIFMISMLLQKA